MPFRTALLVAVSFSFLSPLRAEDWPAWRGPTGLGYSAEKNLPLTWSGKDKKEENIAWKALLHGGRKQNPEFSSPGWSSPIVSKGRVFLTTATWPTDMPEKERRKTIADHHVLCFDANDGKQLWETSIPAGPLVVDNFYHGYNVPTPATDGKYVFALFGSGVLVALDVDGKIVWREELPKMRDIDGGVCSSPVLYDDSVIIPGLQDMGLRALYKDTGKVKWEQKTKSRNTMATPALIKIKDKLQLIHYAGGVTGSDPATGDILWTCKAPTSQASPAFGNGLLFADAGRGGQQGAAIDPTGSGDVSKTHVKWQTRVEGVAAASAIVVGDAVFRSSGSHFIRSWSMTTGEMIDEKEAKGISPSASPIATADGRIYFASCGKSYVIKADPMIEILAVNDLNDGDAYTTPAFANGRIYIKGRSYLWCIGKEPTK